MRLAVRAAAASEVECAVGVGLAESDSTNAVEVGEVKNVSYQALTAQIRDYIGWASQNGYRFNLFVREDTELSEPLWEAARLGLVNVVRVGEMK